MKGWKDCKSVGSKGFILFSKSKASKSALKRWLKSTKMASMQPNEVEGILEAIDAGAEVEGWSDKSRQDRQALIQELWKRLRREEQMWRQKSRISWLLEGDKKTSFFHNMANGRRRRNRITELSLEWVSVSNPSSIREGVFNYFKNQFRKVDWQRPNLS